MTKVVPHPCNSGNWNLTRSPLLYTHTHTDTQTHRHIHTYTQTHTSIQSWAWPFPESIQFKKMATLNFCNDVKHPQLSDRTMVLIVLYCNCGNSKGQRGCVRADKGGTEWKLGYMWSTKLLIRLKWIPSACCLTGQEGEREGGGGGAEVKTERREKEAEQ